MLRICNGKNITGRISPLNCDIAKLAGQFSIIV
jgi:hypothetical protein